MLWKYSQGDFKWSIRFITVEFDQMTEMTLPRLPWLHRAEVVVGKRLRLHFKPGWGDWGFVMLFGPLPIAILAVLRAQNMPIASESAGRGDWQMALLVWLSILAVFGGALWNLFNHWCVLDIDRGSGVQRSSTWGRSQEWVFGSLEGVYVCYYVTRGRNRQDVCEVNVKIAEGFREVHRCFGADAEPFAAALTLIVKEAGMWAQAEDL